MPYSRPTLTDLRGQVASDISSGVKGSDPLLRYANLKITGDAQAGLAHSHFGYLDWISKQAVPWTATGEFLEAWCALKNVFRKPAKAASLTATFSGTPGSTILAGTSVVRGDGETYATQATATVGAGGTAAVTITDSVPGSAGNCAPGTALTLGTAVVGVQSTGAAASSVAVGVDVELDEDLWARGQAAYQAPPQGGSKSDYQTWALQIPGVTRAWIAPNGFGAGTVVVYVMFDIAEAAYGGFPQGVNGVSQYDQGPGGAPRGVVASGDQLSVADYMVNVQPVTALVYACAPVANPINFTISGLTNATTATRAAIAGAITGVFQANGAPGGTINLSDIESAIASIPGTAGFVLASPTTNIANTTGKLPTLGTVTYS